jgi:asparagine synthase (glutamine-hydrolysing)
MCGIAGLVRLAPERLTGLERSLAAMNRLIAHRGPDGGGSWRHEREFIGMTHRRLAIIDLVSGDQPMRDAAGNWIVYNGEVYNYVELRGELGVEEFHTTSDTEVILAAYRRWGPDCVDHLRGMFAFAIWDERAQRLFCARDRFGIKPFYYAQVGDVLYFASEIKALLPFLSEVETDVDGLKDYLFFQFCLAGKTLFRGVRELPPGHVLEVAGGQVNVRRYWEVYYRPDFEHTGPYFETRIQELLADSVRFHLRADVPVGAYVSGGLDSSAVASLAASERRGEGLLGFTGKFVDEPGYDESAYAREVARSRAFELHEIAITADDFVSNISRVIYHLDFPVAGPGSFPQFMVSELAARHRKVLLGGQGGDEIFGGYTRYLVAYFEQCIKGAIDGTKDSGNFIVTYESIIPNLIALRNYKPMLQEFWRDGLFEDPDRRYFRLINRAPSLGAEVRWDELGEYDPFESFQAIFHGNNVEKESYFDSMTHFDFKTLLPALLQVEDRVSMAHGLESRVPYLDHPLVELAATIPANIKFENGNLKHVLRRAVRPLVPESVFNRTDKMGFPVPLQEWLNRPGIVRDFAGDVFSSQRALSRDFIDNRVSLAGLDDENKFGRKVWGILCLELWQQAFHDKADRYRDELNQPANQEVLS